jgi:hypothetical protein
VVAGDSPALGPELSQYLRMILFYLSAQKGKPLQKQGLKNPCQSAKIRGQALLFCRLHFRILPAEALHSASGIHKLLLAGEERVAC